MLVIAGTKEQIERTKRLAAELKKSATQNHIQGLPANSEERPRQRPIIDNGRCFRNQALAESAITTRAAPIIIASLITSRPAPLRNGKPWLTSPDWNRCAESMLRLNRWEN